MPTSGFFSREYLEIFSCTGLYKTLNHSGIRFSFQFQFHNDFFKKIRACSFKEQG